MTPDRSSSPCLLLGILRLMEPLGARVVQKCIEIAPSCVIMYALLTPPAKSDYTALPLCTRPRSRFCTSCNQRGWVYEWASVCLFGSVGVCSWWVFGLLFHELTSRLLLQRISTAEIQYRRTRDQAHPPRLRFIRSLVPSRYFAMIRFAPSKRTTEEL